MESWPTDDRNIEDIPRREGKGKKKEIFQYPNLDHGLLEALTLVEKGNRLEWSSLVKNYAILKAVSTDSDPFKLQAGKPVKIFPETRPPSITLPRMTLGRRAERGANFLRTHFPDVEVAAELIREEIETDARVLHDRSVYNPYDGNLLETVTSYESSTPVSLHLAFPMGELGRDLNISPFLPSENGRVFTPIATPIRSFDTPISQITSPRYDLPNLAQGALLAARTYGVTCVLEMRSCDTPKEVKLFDVATISPSDVGGHQMIDVRFPSVHDLLVVNDQGTAFSYNFIGGKPFIIFDYSTLSSMSEVMSDDFWRLSLGPNINTCLLTSSKVLRQLDCRENGVYNSIFSVPSEKDMITAVEDQDGHLIRLCTTSQLFWIDDRNPGKPILGYNHKRSFDRTLKTDTVSFQNTPFTFLTSRKNGMVNVYTVSRPSENGLIHANGIPYCLTSETDFEDSLIGQSFFHHPYLAEDQSFSLLRLSRRGAIQMIELGQSDGIETPNFEWSDDVRELDLNASNLRPDIGPLGNREYMEVDFSEMYHHVFMERTRQDEECEEENADDVYDLVDRLPLFWQDTDAPIKHMLTTYDIAFRAGDEPDGASRADFLTGSIINSTRGYRALQQERLSPASLSKGSGWYHNIGPTLRAFDSTVHQNAEDILENLQKYNLADSPDRTVQSLRRESKAREQLALDLALSQDVFSVQPPKAPASRPDDLESMTEALSIGNKPPPVDFRYLRPVSRRTADEAREGGEDDDPEMSYPLGVRLLLKEWAVGTDPDTYVYVDPYGDPTDEPARIQLPKPKSNLPKSTQPKRPPVVVASSTMVPIVQPAASRGTFFPQSQPAVVPVLRPTTQSQISNAFLATSSQELMTNTQVLPGPHGGRPPPAAKKKPAKKRLVHIYIFPLVCMDFAARSRKNDSLEQRKKPKKHARDVNTSNLPYDSAAYNDFLRRNKAVVCALSASYISTFAGYPLDSLKSRLQTTKTPISVSRLAAVVYRDEGVVGFYRGLWIPLITILLCPGAMSGALISFGSAPFELVKVRRQLEFAIAASKGVQLTKAPKTWEAVKEIFQSNGITGLYTGFRMHFVRDTTGTALYFLEYDGMRHLLGRDRSGDQGPTPAWLPIPASIVPFFCGSLSGVSSWALIYPLDVVKTKIQQRSLAGERYRGPWETLYRLVRGPDPNNPKPLLAGITRIYRGLGVSAVRSITTHGLLWTFFDLVSNYIDHLP
ncbi:uncharacterized protein EV420DRAFT_1476592 [Desarmillaria tabescens]|uniref:RRN6 beta-propeller domain-containing protein n=1 Tax=Armillaria tabescens TaxID=1929756 RepID=A0AA39NE45_ARMTA|nr:uncharacterized protein EV420DRAFT_1476592 [Desarmillaria tabescens]KAK0463972.1 hypothetical protein EV420DRAFT_1476592 [Desarmillaria tabescens]